MVSDSWYCLLLQFFCFLLIGVYSVYCVSYVGNCVDFEDSLNMTPRQPYNPSLQPDRTILKPSPDVSQLKAAITVKRKSPRRPQAADFFWSIS